MADKAFIFDLDGVIIDSETWWDKLWVTKLKLGPSMGHTINSEFQALKQHNPKLSWGQYFAKLNKIADKIYRQAPLTPNINQLLTRLVKDKYLLGLVSASTQQWINYVLKRLNYPLDITISLHDRPDLKPKPAPDAYLQAMQQLQVKPQNTIILEDSHYGVQSAKASGAYTICLTEHWPKNYSAPGADRYIKTLSELNLYPNFLNNSL